MAKSENPGPNVAAESFVPTTSLYYGVRGWLLFLCVGLTILGPIAAVMATISSYESWAKHFDQFPRLETVIPIEMLMTLGMAGFSAYAGLGLWTLRREAVRMAKIYFAFFLAYGAMKVVFIFLYDLPPKATQTMLPTAIGDFVKMMIAVAIWYSYLSKSKRVKATYGD